MERIACVACLSDKTDLLRQDCENCGQRCNDTTLNLSGWRQLSQVESEEYKKEQEELKTKRIPIIIRLALMAF